MITADLPIYSVTRKVTNDEIDDLNHVNNVVYNQWANEIAVEHWLNVGTEALKKQFDWVMIKHNLEYKAAAFLGDTIEIKTQVGQATNVKYERFIEIYNATTKQLLVKTKSVWCAINKKGKPVKISQELRDLFETLS